MIKLMFAAMLLLACTTAHAYECDSPECPEECPIGSSYYTNHAGLEFCVFFGIALPQNAVAACDNVTPTPMQLVGWVGYSFLLASNAGYVCAEGFHRAPDKDGRGLCFAAAWPPHPGAFAYCGYLVSGCDPDYGCYEGYGWSE